LAAAFARETVMDRLARAPNFFNDATGRRFAAAFFPVADRAAALDFVRGLALALRPAPAERFEEVFDLPAALFPVPALFRLATLFALALDGCDLGLGDFALVFTTRDLVFFTCFAIEHPFT
jgi:hypothetical protein